MFLAALFTITKTWKQPKCPLTDEWIKKVRYIYTTEYYSAVKKNEITPFAATWMQLEILIPSEVSQKEEDKYCVIPHISDIIWYLSSLNDLLHLVWESLVATMLLQMALFCSFLWLSSILLCIYTLHLNPIICRWTFMLFPCLGYCEECCNEHADACVFFKESFVRIEAQEWDCWVIW